MSHKVSGTRLPRDTTLIHTQGQIEVACNRSELVSLVSNYPYHIDHSSVLGII